MAIIKIPKVASQAVNRHIQNKFFFIFKHVNPFYHFTQISQCLVALNFAFFAFSICVALTLALRSILRRSVRVVATWPRALLYALSKSVLNFGSPRNTSAKSDRKKTRHFLHDQYQQYEHGLWNPFLSLKNFRLPLNGL